MPSGDEWCLLVPADLTTLRDCAEAICDVWPDAVVEDARAGEFAYSVGSLLPSEQSELCVYRDLEVTRRWQRGATPEEMHNSMVQVSLSPYGVRLITDDWQDPVIANVVRRLQVWQAECGSELPNCRIV